MPCEESLAEYSPLTIYLIKSGGDILIYLKNNGPNIIVIKRLVLYREWSEGGRTINYLRGSDFIIGGEVVEQGSTHLKYRASAANAISATARAEYFEITGRSRACEIDLTQKEIKNDPRKKFARYL
ncbi:MAG: hypothetical protein COS92_03935 [Desulfobacterales bacterium CG07_land_8_20_14_0_80_52_14]|nr:MAG: hypothetical protein COX20_01215 [Desulfobacterales bacterium CG23_combo_of_CG06-09_8_20_14_all_52_9]PIU49937.1 MAG: hypothetical protein COS92_03935 [Desulfobacterales bacterium CG07_land_8_20_14_0_80_52_14]